jgi:PadR family transcriptional regulator, regulatory protein AphA
MSPLNSRPLNIELALLCYLRQGSLHGYQIHQHLLETGGLGQVWQVKQANLYSLLSKLEEAGFIIGSLEVQHARPNRFIYHLTKAGDEAYLQWLITAVNTPRQMRQGFMAKLYCAMQEGAQFVLTLVENQRLVCQRWLDNQNLLLSTIANDLYNRQIHQYRLGQIQATYNWLQNIKISIIDHDNYKIKSVPCNKEES